MLGILAVPEQDQVLIKSRRGRRGKVMLVSPFLVPPHGYRSGLRLPLGRSRRVHQFHRLAPHLSRYWVDGDVEVDVAWKLPDSLFGGLKAGMVQASCRLVRGTVAAHRRLLLEPSTPEIEVPLTLPPRPQPTAETMSVVGTVLEKGFAVLVLQPGAATLYFTLIDPGLELVATGTPAQAQRFQRLFQEVMEIFMISPEGGVRLLPGVLQEDFSGAEHAVLIRCRWDQAHPHGRAAIIALEPLSLPAASESPGESVHSPAG